MRFKVFALVALGCFSAASALTPSSAAARSPSKPGMDLVGKYKVENCGLFGFDDVDKAIIRAHTNSRENFQTLELFGFSESNRADEFIKIGSGTREAESDGTETWKTDVDASGVTFTERYDRKGARDWHDLGFEQSYRFEKTGDVVTLTYKHKRLYGPGKDRNATCTLTDITEVPSEAYAYEMGQLFDTKLEALAASNLQKLGDLDQAGIQLVRGGIKGKNHTKAQIQEMLNMHFLPNFSAADSTTITRVKNPVDAKKVTAEALATVIGIAKDAIDSGADKKDYAGFLSFQKKVEKFIQDRNPKWKLYMIEWSESDSDGEGVLVIDEENEQALYIGSAYFS